MCTVDDDGLVAVNACEHSVISSGGVVVIWLPPKRVQMVVKIEIEMQVLVIEFGK